MKHDRKFSSLSTKSSNPNTDPQLDDLLMYITGKSILLQYKNVISNLPALPEVLFHSNYGMKKVSS